MIYSHISHRTHEETELLQSCHRAATHRVTSTHNLHLPNTCRPKLQLLQMERHSLGPTALPQDNMPQEAITMFDYNLNITVCKIFYWW